MLGRLDGEDEDENRLWYSFLKDLSVSQKNESELEMESK